MKRAIRLLSTAVFSILIIYMGKSQKQQAKYTDYDRGYYFFYYKKWDSAFMVLNRYINDTKDTLTKGKAYNLMGDMLWKIGDLYGAQQSLTDAIRTLDIQNKIHQQQIGYAYNLLGNVSQDLKQYREAINFYDSAINIFKGEDYFPEVMNGKASALQKMRNYNAAVAIYDSALTLKPADQKLIARIIDNRAKTKWLQHPGYNALPEFWTALKIRIDSQFRQGLNASYAHLSDYYANPNPDSALWYAKKMLESAIANQNPDDKLEALDKMIRFTASPVLKEQWYEDYKKLNDSLQLARDTTRYRFALIRYEVQKSKAANLALQQHVTRQRGWIYGVTAFAIAAIAGLVLWYQKRKKRIKQETNNAIRDSKLKISQKVHDVVANSLYRIMNELEHTDAVNKEVLLDDIEGLYEKSRDISYDDIAAVSYTDYDKQFHHLLNAFANDETNVFIIGNEEAFWKKITNEQKKELELIFNELMVNMKKHSLAKNVVIEFSQENKRGYIKYKDDGIGFTGDFKLGNGLKNTVSRIKSLNGEITFGTNEKAGISIEMNFPLQFIKND